MPCHTTEDRSQVAVRFQPCRAHPYHRDAFERGKLYSKVTILPLIRRVTLNG